MRLKFLAIFLTGFVGGIAGALLVSATPLHAAFDKVNFGELSVYNRQSKRVALLTPGHADQGTFWLFDREGDFRVQIGTYESGSEIGQPLVGLHDKNDSLRALLRLYGSSDSPVLVFKDSTGYDRLTLGLRGSDEVPYLEYTNSQGQRINLLK